MTARRQTVPSTVAITRHGAAGEEWKWKRAAETAAPETSA